MKISVVVAACRPSGPMAQALASVAGQEHADWELFVTDEGPPNDNAELIRHFGRSSGRPVHYEHVGESQGLAAARNRLLRLATGEAVAFHDPGDTWTPRHLANALQQLESGADVVVSDVRLTTRTSARGSDVTPPSQLTTNPTRALFAHDAIPWISAVVIRRTVSRRVGEFDTRFHIAEGRDYWLRCAISGARFAATHRSTCRATPPTGDSAVRALQAAEDAAEFYEKHRDLPGVPAALRRRLLAASLVACGGLLRKSDPNRAARYFWRAWSLQPVHIQTLGQFALTSWRSGPPDEPPEQH